MTKYTYISLILIFIATPSFSQKLDTTVIPSDWFLQDPDEDNIQGMSVNRAYRELLQNHSSQAVIVAVVDSGFDIKHEDLKGSIWINEDEIPGNGIDDDGNGYIDDVSGWNFIGGEQGSVNQDGAELTREYVRLKTEFVDVDTSKIRGAKKEVYKKYREIKAKFKHQLETNTANFEIYNKIYQNTIQGVDTLKALLNIEHLMFDNIEAFESDDPSLIFFKKYLLSIFNDIIGPKGDLDDFILELNKMVDHFDQVVKYVYNESFDPRAIVGDRYEDSYEKGYGNNDIKGFGDGTLHGTHVAGIIGANRNNVIGIRGVADNAIIMPLRVVPNGGDERDKDVANAIVYAVNNGAKIINMSFGKSISPQKKVVDRAVRYAEKKGVLIIHAAGNDGKNLDTEANFPSQYYGRRKQRVETWLEVGASSWNSDKDFAANFSNYGKEDVDIFAPGVHIKSTITDNGYGFQQGTSMAAPMVTGVAALLLSYFPQLSAIQLKDIICRSARQYVGLHTLKPGSDQEEVEFAILSNTGGVVNAYKAIKLASSFSKGLN